MRAVIVHRRNLKFNKFQTPVVKASSESAFHYKLLIRITIKLSPKCDKRRTIKFLCAQCMRLTSVTFCYYVFSKRKKE